MENSAHTLKHRHTTMLTSDIGGRAVLGDWDEGGGAGGQQYERKAGSTVPPPLQVRLAKEGVVSSRTYDDMTKLETAELVGSFFENVFVLSCHRET